MAGELWRVVTQIGKETTYGTSVAATRKMYFREPVLTREREPRSHKFAVGARDNVRAFTLGPIVAAGKIEMAMSADELIELLLLGIKGGVTPSTVETTGRRWTFTPDPVLDSATVRWDDGARPWKATGCYVDQINIKGAANEENMVTADFFAKDVIQEALTGSLTDRVPRFSEGWETKLFIDAFAGTPGTTNIAGTLVNWDVTIKNNLDRKYFADNTNATGAVTIGELEVEAKLTFEASVAQALTEFNNWDAATKRLVRLQFGNNETISGTSTPLKYLVNIDMPGAWGAVDLSADDAGTRVYELTLHYVYDSTNAFGVRFIVDNARAAAY